MRQIPLSLDTPQEPPVRLALDPEREQRLIALMAEAIVAIMRSTRETDDERWCNVQEHTRPSGA